MTELSDKTKLNLHRILIAFCALATAMTLTLTAKGFQQKSIMKVLHGTAGSLFTGCGLGMSIGAYLSSPYRKRQRG